MKLLTVVPFLWTLAAAQDYVVVDRQASDIAADESVTYDCKLSNLWTAARHPVAFPSGAHWSPPVLVSHQGRYRMFETGSLATNGVEQVAETGGTVIIVREIAAASDNILDAIVAGSGFGTTLTSAVDLKGLQFNSDYTLLSIISMIAPSPDWFTGVAGYNMLAKGTWLSTVTLDLYPYDAGTDAGTTYTAADADQNPAQPIQQLTVDTAPGGIFVSPAGKTVLPVARLQCSLQGSNLPQCRRSVTDRCSTLREHCCPGLSCQSAPGERRRTCLPCLHATQTCMADADCCGSLHCTGGTCVE